MFELSDNVRAAVMVGAWFIGQVALFVYIRYGGKCPPPTKEDE